MTAPLSDDHLAVITWAAEECERQRSGELSVGWMLNAWSMALRLSKTRERPTEDDVLLLASLVEPEVNREGYRIVGVRVGASVKGPWQEVPGCMKRWAERLPDATAEDAWFAFETIHPFRDGNGRVGSLIYLWLLGSLHEPFHSPDWEDPTAYWRPPHVDAESWGLIDETWSMIRAAERGWVAHRRQDTL